MFSRVQSPLVYLLYGTTVVVIITYIIVLTIHFTWCTPVHRNWTVSLQEFPGTSSIDNLTTLTVGSFLNVATDLMILILPLLIVKSFNLKQREKWGLCFIFAVGVMCVTASVVRYYKMYVPFDHPPATVEGARVAFLWSTIEVTTGFIAFCLPSFRLVLFRAIKRGRDTIRNKHRSAALPHVAGTYSTKGYSNSKHPSIDSSGAKSKKKSLPRHPNTLLTTDFATLHPTMSREDNRDPRERGSIMYPPNALASGSGGGDAHIDIVYPEVNYSSPDKVNGIQVTNCATSLPEDCDTAKKNTTYYRFPVPPSTPFAAVSDAGEHGDEYVLMPMQRAYDPSAVRAGSQENLRPTSRDRQYSAV